MAQCLTQTDIKEKVKLDSIWQEWRQKSSGFNEFIQNQEERPDMMGLKVNALLITPVQRVPR